MEIQKKWGKKATEKQSVSLKVKVAAVNDASAILRALGVISASSGQLSFCEGAEINQDVELESVCVCQDVAPIRGGHLLLEKAASAPALPVAPAMEDATFILEF